MNYLLLWSALWLELKLVDDDKHSTESMLSSREMFPHFRVALSAARKLVFIHNIMDKIVYSDVLTHYLKQSESRGKLVVSSG